MSIGFDLCFAVHSAAVGSEFLIPAPTIAWQTTRIRDAVKLMVTQSDDLKTKFDRLIIDLDFARVLALNRIVRSCFFGSQENAIFGSGYRGHQDQG